MSSLASLTTTQLVNLLEQRNAPPCCLKLLVADGYPGSVFFTPGVALEQAIDEAFEDLDSRREHGIKPLHIRTFKLLMNELAAAERSGPPQQQKQRAVVQLAPEPARETGGGGPRGGGAAAAAVAAPACTPAELPVASPPPPPSGKKKKRAQQPQQQPQDQLAPPPPRPDAAANDGDDDGDGDASPPAPAAASIDPNSLASTAAAAVVGVEVKDRAALRKEEQSDFDKLRARRQQAVTALKEALRKAVEARRVMCDAGVAGCKDISKAEASTWHKLTQERAEAAAKIRRSKTCIVCNKLVPESGFSAKEYAAAVAAAAAADETAAASSSSSSVSSASASLALRGGRCTACKPKKGELFAAALAGDAPRMREIFRRGGANIADEKGSCQLFPIDSTPLVEGMPLIFAAAAAPAGRSVEVMRLVVENGGNVNTVERATGLNGTVLHRAACDGNVPLVHFLLAAGATVDAKIRGGATPLYPAAQEGHTAVVDLLLRHGASANESKEGGGSVLLIAAEKGHADVCGSLLAAGANANFRNPRDGSRPLHRSAGYGHTEVVRLLLSVDGIDVNAATIEGHTPLKTAVMCEHEEVVRLLLSAGADATKICDRNGNTAFHYARDQPSILKLLTNNSQ